MELSLLRTTAGLSRGRTIPRQCLQFEVRDLLGSGRGSLSCWINRTHQSNSDAVRVFDDGIACAPEGIIGRLQADITGSGKVRVVNVHSFTAGHLEAHHDFPRQIVLPRPAPIPDLGKGRIVEIYRNAIVRTCARVARATRVAPHLLWDRKTKAPIKCERLFHIPDHDVQLVEEWFIGHSIRSFEILLLWLQRLRKGNA